MTSKKVIVVGAGIVGAAIAHRLSSAGMAVTVVAEKDGGVASPASFGWINASWGNRPDYADFRMKAMAEWRALVGEMPRLPVSFRGGLLWDLQREELEKFVAEHRKRGYAISTVGRDKAAAIEPGLATPPEFAAFAADEGSAEPAEIARFLAQVAMARGMSLISARVLRLRTRNGAVTGIETVDGSLEADAVVIAAGTGSADLARTAGVSVPIDSPPGLLVWTEPASEPIVNGLVLSPGLHMRATADRRLVAGADFGGAEPGDDALATAHEIQARMTRLFSRPVPPFSAYTIGLRPMPRDEHPILGLVPGVPGLSIAVTHSGVTLAPLIGRLISGEIESGEPHPDLAAWSLERFSSGA